MLATVTSDLKFVLQPNFLPVDECKDENEGEDEEYDQAIKDLAAKLVNTVIGGAVEICSKE